MSNAACSRAAAGSGEMGGASVRKTLVSTSAMTANCKNLQLLNAAQNTQLRCRTIHLQSEWY